MGFLDKSLQIIQLTQAIASMMPRSAPEYSPPPLENTDPMEGMATSEELKQYLYCKGAFYLGRLNPDHNANDVAGIKDDRHIFIVAGNASGKGRSIVVQNALRWKGGFVGLDPKGELASITAIRRGTEEQAKGTGTSVRHFIGQEVAVLDPFNETVGASRIYKKNYNPLSDIDINAPNAQELIKSIASASIVPEQGETAHFSDNAETIVAGIIEVILITEPKENHTLSFVRQLAIKPFEELMFILKDIDPEEGRVRGEKAKSLGRLPADGLAVDAWGMLEDAIGSNEASGFKTTLSKNFKWLSEPQIKTHTAKSDFSLRDLVKKGGSVYIVIPPNRMDAFKNWLRIILQTCINAKIELGVNQTTQQTLFMLDEFPLLGRFKEIEKSAGFLRGYNCKLVCVIQNIGQIKSLYAKNWETFLGNAGAIIGFSLNDHETEEYLSNRMGKIMAWETSYSTNQGVNAQGINGGMNEGKTVNQAQRERSVRFSNEIHEQTARDTMRAFVIPADGKPFSIQRQNYDDIKGNALFDSPKFNMKWEKDYGGKL